MTFERCEVGPISFERYAQEGWLLEADTRARQGCDSPGSQEAWKRIVIAAADLKGCEAWGATVGGRLASALLVTQLDDCAHILYQQSHREFLPLGVNAAFTYSVTRALKQRPDVRMVHYGLQSLAAPASVDEFKFRMGYSRRPVRQRRRVSSAGESFDRPGHARRAQARAQAQRSTLQAKGEGLVRVYLEGRRATAELPRPGAIAVSKE